jgi:hypothetical protein
MHHTLTALAVIISCVSIATIFGTLFQCRPIAAAWDFAIPDAQCIQVRPLYYFSTTFSLATDVLLCVLPLPFFWKLKVSQREKLVVSCLFGLGLFAAAASAMRLTRLASLNDINITMKAMPALGWSVAEVIVGIVCACLPCLKPLVTRLLPGKFFSKSGHARTTMRTDTAASDRSTVSEMYVIEGPRLAKYPSQTLANLSQTGSGLWRGRGESWYKQPTLKAIGSWRDGHEKRSGPVESV